MASVSMLARGEEPLIRQLVRSRALLPREQSLSPRGNGGGQHQPQQQHQQIRSMSQPAPMQRMPLPGAAAAGSPVYQFFPGGSATSASIPIAVSQPDLTRIPSSPLSYSPTVSRCQSPTLMTPPMTPVSPVPPSATVSPMSSTRPGTPVQPMMMTPAAAPDLINSIYSPQKDIFLLDDHADAVRFGLAQPPPPLQHPIPMAPPANQFPLPPQQHQCQMCNLFHNSVAACPSWPPPQTGTSAGSRHQSGEVTLIPCPICPAIQNNQERGSQQQQQQNGYFTVAAVGTKLESSEAHPKTEDESNGYESRQAFDCFLRRFPYIDRIRKTSQRVCEFAYFRAKYFAHCLSLGAACGQFLTEA